VTLTGHQGIDALQRVAGAPNLSRDLRDIVDRSLAVS